MKKRIFIIILISAILLISLTCVFLVFDVQVLYNAKLYSHSEDLLLPEFLDANKVRGAYYLNPDYDPDDENSDEYYRDKESPKNRMFVIEEEDTFKKIFKENSLDVNWDKEMVILYIFSDDSPRDYKLKSISVSNDKIQVHYKFKGNGWRKDSSAPYQRCLALTMKKQDVQNVEFIND